MKEREVAIEVNSNFHHVTGKDVAQSSDKKFQEYRKRWKEQPESFCPGDFPLFLDVEVTSVCNLHCPLCARTFQRKKIPAGYMSFDLIKKIIDEGADNGLYGIKFNIRGEPLLHKELCDFIAYAKKKGLIDVYFNTNGVFLDKKTCRKLIESKLDRISISFEGYTKDVYERYRVGSNFEKVVANIEGLKQVKRECGVNYPKVRIQTVLLPELKPSLEAYKQFWFEKADEIAFLDYREETMQKTGIVYPWACSQPWQRMAIWWDGTILPCNQDDNGLLALGNVSKMSIKDAWQSTMLNKIREEHKKGLSHIISACAVCHLRDNEIQKLKEKK